MLDAFDLAVRLELEGVTDSVSRSDYGFSSTMAMARRHLKGLHVEDPPIKRDEVQTGFLQYLNGIAFAIPVLICTFTMLYYRFSLWGGDLTPDAAAAVAIGTIYSFVTTGGIVQASARRTLYQIHVGDWDAAVLTCYRWTILGVKVLLSSLFFGWLLNQYFVWIPSPMDMVALSFHLVLGMFWLACGILYVLELSWAVGGAVIAGIAAVAFLHLRLGQPLLVSQIGGIIVAAVLSFTLAGFVLRHKKRGKGDVDFLTARIAHGVSPFFLYGCGYYFFLFADRFLAWTAHTRAFALPFHFRGDYETALDVAMIAFVLQAGWVHVSMLEFYKRLNSGKAIIALREYATFNSGLRQFYLKRASTFLIVGAVSGIVTYSLSVRYGLLPTPAMQHVAAAAFAAYPLLVLGLWNSGLFFALSRPGSPLIAVTAGLVINIMVGYVFSRFGTYDQAVYGFAAGSAVFAALTTFRFLQLSRSIDHVHFASAV